MTNLTSSLEQLGWHLMKQIQSQHILRLILTDKDLQGRDLMTIISQNQIIKLLKHDFISKLSRQTWEGPYLVDSNPFINYTSWIAIKQLFKPRNTHIDPISSKKLQLRKEEIKGRNKNFAFKFNSWVNGIQIRYFTAILLYAVIAVTIQILLQQLMSNISQIANLVDNSSTQQNLTQQLKHLDNSFKVNCQIPSFPIDVYDDNVISQAAAANGQTSQQLLRIMAEFMCVSQSSAQFQQSILDNFFTLNIFIAFQYIILLVFFIKTSRPIKHLFFNLAFLFDFMLFLASFLIVFYSNPITDKLVRQFDGSKVSVYVQWGDEVGARLPSLYSICMAAMWMRLFFSFKVTRLFGPFIKIIKLNIKYFMKWLLIFMLYLLTATAAILLIRIQGLQHVDSSQSQNMSCDSITHCLYFLIQGSVGEIGFQQLPNKWYSEYIYSFVIIIFMVLFLSILIASMTNTYNEIVEKGQLFYQKEIFDLRYQYNSQTRYGALAAFEFPFVVLQFFTLLILWFFQLCFEKKSKKNKVARKTHKFNFQDIIQPKRQEEQIIYLNLIIFSKRKICVLCCKITKFDQDYKNVQHEDINLIILKLIHFINIILIFTPLVFVLGFMLIPVAYFSIIILKITIICRKNNSKPNASGNRSYQTIGIKKHFQRFKQHYLTAKRVSRSKLFCELIFFVATGLFHLLILHFYDTYKYVQQCFAKDQKEYTKLQYKGKQKYFLPYQDMIKALEVVNRQKKIYDKKMQQDMNGQVNEQLLKQEEKQIKIADGSRRQSNNIFANMQTKDLSQLIISFEELYGQSVSRDISHQTKDLKKNEQKINNPAFSPLTQNFGSPESYGKYFDSTKLKTQKNRQIAEKKFRKIQILVKKNDNNLRQQSQSFSASLFHRKTSLQKLFSFFELDQNLKYDYQIPLKNLHGILFGFLKMSQVKHKIKQLRQNSMRKRSHYHSNFNLSINGQEFTGIYDIFQDKNQSNQFNQFDDKDQLNSSSSCSNSFIEKENVKYRGNKNQFQELNENEEYDQSKSLFNIVDQSTEQQNEIVMQRKQERRFLQKQHILEQEMFLLKFKAFVNAESIVDKAFGILTFGSFNLKSSIESCYQFCLEKRRDENLSDVQRLLLSYNYIDSRSSFQE